MNEQRPSKELVTCATHAAEHRMRDTLPCPWCVIDELKRGRDTLQTTVEYFNAQLYRLAKVVQKDGETAEAVVTKTIEILADWPTEPPLVSHPALAAWIDKALEITNEPGRDQSIYISVLKAREIASALRGEGVFDCNICGGRVDLSNPKKPTTKVGPGPRAGSTKPAVNCDHDPMSHGSTLECDSRGALICKHCDEFDRSHARRAEDEPVCTCPDERPETMGHADDCPRKLRASTETFAVHFREQK